VSSGYRRVIRALRKRSTSVVAPDAITELADALDGAGLTVSMSAHCRSGIVGRDVCRCWRCRGEKGPTADESAAERDAKLIDAGKAWGQGLARHRNGKPTAPEGGR